MTGDCDLGLWPYTRSRGSEPRRDFNSGSPAPLRPRDGAQRLTPLPGAQGAKPPAGTSTCALCPAQVPPPRPQDNRRGRITHVSSKCCSKVASIPPAVPSSRGPSSESLPSPPQAPCTPRSRDTSEPGRRLPRAKLRGATSALCIGSAHCSPAAGAGSGCCCPRGDR